MAYQVINPFAWVLKWKIPNTKKFDDNLKMMPKIK